MNNNWNDLNTADPQGATIPKGVIAKVRMTIRPGGYDDHSRNWTGGYATRKAASGSVYLDCEYVITEGKYARRKVWSMIGLHSIKGPEWGNMGRSFVRGILNSAHGVSDKDNSPRATEARRIKGFKDLDGIEFLAKIDVEEDQHGADKNVIKIAITPDHKDYKTHMGTAVSPPPGAYGSPQSAPQTAPAEYQSPQPAPAPPPAQAAPDQHVPPPAQAAPDQHVPPPAQAAPTQPAPPPVDPAPQSGLTQPTWAQ